VGYDNITANNVASGQLWLAIGLVYSVMVG